jgi:RNA polymerase-binding transcription factor DksA
MAATKKSATKQTAKQAPAKRTAAKGPARKSAPAKQKAPARKAAASTGKATATTSSKKAAVSTAPAPPVDVPGIPAPRGRTKDGIAYTKDFDVKFLKTQHELLVAERKALVGQANRLEDEANSLIEEGEMGDVQFDDESGEGDTMVVERERDLALSAQARQTIADIDAALRRMADGTYGYSVASGRPIPRERLEAIPWATVLVEEKVGGIGRR